MVNECTTAHISRIGAYARRSGADATEVSIALSFGKLYGFDRWSAICCWCAESIDVDNELIVDPRFRGKESECESCRRLSDDVLVIPVGGSDSAHA